MASRFYDHFGAEWKLYIELSIYCRQALIVVTTSSISLRNKFAIFYKMLLRQLPTSLCPKLPNLHNRLLF